jgi:hypothetical protein
MSLSLKHIPKKKKNRKSFDSFLDVLNALISKSLRMSSNMQNVSQI